MALFHELLSTPKAHTFFKANVRNGFTAKAMYAAWQEANRYSDKKLTLRDFELSSGEQSPLLFSNVDITDRSNINYIIQAANCINALDIAAISSPAEELAFWLSEDELGGATTSHALHVITALTCARYTGGYVKIHSRFTQEFRDTPFAEFSPRMVKLAAGLWVYEQYMEGQLLFTPTTFSAFTLDAWCSYVYQRLDEMRQEKKNAS